jgi:hypothetical protein
VLSNVSAPSSLYLVAEATDNMGTSTYSDTVNIQVFAPSIPLPLASRLVNRSGQEGSTTYYHVTVPAGLNGLAIDTYGGVGDCDLFVARGYPPSQYQWHYTSCLSGNEESVAINHPANGDWYIMVYGKGAYSGVTLEAWTW